MNDKQKDAYKHLEQLVLDVTPIVEGAKIIEVMGHWEDDGSFITPAFVIAPSGGKLMKLMVSIDEELCGPGTGALKWRVRAHCHNHVDV